MQMRVGRVPNLTFHELLHLFLQVSAVRAFWWDESFDSEKQRFEETQLQIDAMAASLKMYDFNLQSTDEHIGMLKSRAVEHSARAVEHSTLNSSMHC